MGRKLNSIDDVKEGMTIVYLTGSQAPEFYDAVEVKNDPVAGKTVTLKCIEEYQCESIKPLEKRDIFEAYTIGRTEGYGKSFSKLYRDCELTDKIYSKKGDILMHEIYPFTMPGIYHWEEANSIKAIPTVLDKAFCGGIKDRQKYDED